MGRRRPRDATHELALRAIGHQHRPDRARRGFDGAADRAPGARAILCARPGRLAVRDRALPRAGTPAGDASRARDLGTACIEAMRTAIGPDVALKIDVHSYFDVDLAVDVARRLEPRQLSWYEEPVPPTDLDGTKTIHDAITQPMAGGEFLP